LLRPDLRAPPPPRHDPEEVRELADRILARDEFQPPSETLLERIARWIADLFDGGGGGTTTPFSFGTGGSVVFTLLLLAVAIVAIVFVVRALLGRPRRKKQAPEPEPEAEVEVVRSVDEWTEAAQRHEAAGQWKDGLRCRFRALVVRLTERGIVPEIAGRTSGELRADVRAVVPPAGPDFDGAAELFDRAWYGDLPTGPEEARRFADHADRVLTSSTEAS
jgi:hypothetical protein